MKPGGCHAALINDSLQIWLLRQLIAINYDPDIILLDIQAPLSRILEQLTKNKVFFAIDDAQVAQQLFQEIEIINASQVKR